LVLVGKDQLTVSVQRMRRLWLLQALTEHSRNLVQSLLHPVCVQPQRVPLEEQAVLGLWEEQILALILRAAAAAQVA
jgi:hypothetical protein